MKSHEWACLDGGVATFGISNYAQVTRSCILIISHECTHIHTHARTHAHTHTVTLLSTWTDVLVCSVFESESVVRRRSWGILCLWNCLKLAPSCLEEVRRVEGEEVRGWRVRG